MRGKNPFSSRTDKFGKKEHQTKLCFFSVLVIRLLVSHFAPFQTNQRPALRSARSRLQPHQRCSASFGELVLCSRVWWSDHAAVSSSICLLKLDRDTSHNRTCARSLLLSCTRIITNASTSHFPVFKLEPDHGPGRTQATGSFPEHAILTAGRGASFSLSSRALPEYSTSWTRAWRPPFLPGIYLHILVT